AIVNPDNNFGEENKENNVLYLYFAASSEGFNIFPYMALAAIVAAIAPILVYIYKMKRKKVRIKDENRELRCDICFGKFKPGVEIVRCECGAVFHKSCAKRVGVCPNCGRKLDI
ncbi:MAG: hypothetical protein J7J36_01520, partial [Thermoplasmata archaeon]|nr:hypothetical protein [Thermoplasmata archaeon]